MSAQIEPRIAIVGGGLGGLSLLVHLQRQGLSATLYERDSTPESRGRMGSMLDMHHTSGQRALDQAGISWRHLIRPEREDTKICGKEAAVLHCDTFHEGTPAEHSRPEMERVVLRELLLEACDTSRIQWNKHCIAAEPLLTTGGYRLRFESGETVDCDLLVGADGANSKIRPLLSESKVVYAGFTGVETHLSPTTVAEVPDLAELVGDGSVFAVDDEKSLILKRGADGCIRCYAWYRAASEVVPRESQELREHVLQVYREWSPLLQQVISKAETIAPRPAFILPIGHQWASKAGVTLLGDAAHLMSPFAGEGANLAMQDGLELANELARHRSKGAPKWWDDATKVYEPEMCQRAQAAAEESNENLHIFLSKDAPQSAVAFMQSLGPPDE